MFVFLYIICGIDLNHINIGRYYYVFVDLLAGAFLIVYWDVIEVSSFVFTKQGITSRTLLILANIDSIDFNPQIPIYREAAKRFITNCLIGNRRR